MSYRLKFTATAHNGMFPRFRYPSATQPPYPTRERAEQVRAAMPEPDNFEIEETD